MAVWAIITYNIFLNVALEIAVPLSCIFNLCMTALFLLSICKSGIVT